jgi:hypothetical protein
VDVRERAQRFAANWLGPFLEIAVRLKGSGQTSNQGRVLPELTNRLTTFQPLADKSLAAALPMPEDYSGEKTV